MPIRVMVTGVAGFIGSHLAEELLARGFEVIGIDCFTDFYPRAIKEANLANLQREARFCFIEQDLLQMGETPWLDGVSYLFHHAAQAGVRGSWGTSFDEYVRNNVLVTQRVLEAAKASPLKGLIFASSSSIYGDAETLPTREDAPPRPVSPYGVTKLACEHLCRTYFQSWGVPVTTLRYFTVYGPRQRPDMGFARFIRALTRGEEIVIFGDGMQTRDFTFVADAVQASLRAMEMTAPGECFNIGGGARVTIKQVIAMLEKIVGTSAQVRQVEVQKGDARHTSADISKAKAKLGYVPRIQIEEGLRRQYEWGILLEKGSPDGK